MKWIERRSRKIGFDRVGSWAMVILFVEVLVLILYSYLLSHPDVDLSEENRYEFARVAILMDGTQSVNPKNFSLIKRIVREKILPSLGMNDLAVAYDVHKNFATGQNTVFGILGDQLPQDSEDRRAQILDILERNREKGKPDDDLYVLIRSLPSYRTRVAEVRSLWARQVEKREAPRLEGSDICSPLSELGEFLRGGDPAAEKWLFVLSDMKNTGPSRNCRPEDSFPNARVVLIYPFDSNSPSWKTVESFWRDFFAGRKLERVPFPAALADRALLSPNPTAGLERYEIKTPWECARPMIVPALALALGLLAAVSLITALAPHAGERVRKQEEASAGSTPETE